MAVAKKKIEAKKLPVKPVGYIVMIKPDDVLKKTESGIITGTADEHSREEVAMVEGTLVAVGHLAWKDCGDGSPWAKVGDRVYFKRHVADRIKDESDIVDGKAQIFFLLTDRDILGVLEA